MDPSSTAVYLVGLLVICAAFSAATFRAPRLSLLVSAFGFGMSEILVGRLAAFERSRLSDPWLKLPPIEAPLLALSGFRLDVASLVLLFCAASYLLLHSIQIDSPNRGRLGPLFLIAAAAGVLCASSNDLIVTFVGLQAGSFAVHGISVFGQPSSRKVEAAWKQYIFHGLGTACFLLGTALFRAQFGTHSPSEADLSGPLSPLHSASCLLILFGCLQPMGAFPFLSWPADNAEGAPGAGLFLETSGRLVTLGAFLPIFLEALLPIKEAWLSGLYLVGVCTLAWGALGALAQNNLNRLLAYLSQAHVGWILLFGAACAEKGTIDGHFLPAALVFGLVALGLRAAAFLIEREARDGDVYQLSGLGETHPLFALWFTILCLAGAGLPPTSGYSAQISLFLGLMPHLRILWILALTVGTLTIAFSFFRLVSYVYGKECREPLALTHRAALPIACTSICALLVVALMFLWK